ncbi:hypothetical protein Pla110_18360 [Polystyrenella longa]|uniref:Integrase catalytic domain-containing protein n=1 Tax=Polystyrenella longa TaxID=2528007 RepID=A0A518CLQ9_9PLAN|nr:hypothetical protein [Polystyrenella longa]QDU80114.1 hypothetical protein Pla110_18360 [Polystyrenella longa]
MSINSKSGTFLNCVTRRYDPKIVGKYITIECVFPNFRLANACAILFPCDCAEPAFSVVGKSTRKPHRIGLGQHSLGRALNEYVAHYHSERNHQGLDDQLIDPDEVVGSLAGKIECRERLGGLLKYYYRDAA